MKTTYMATREEALAARRWYVIDARDQVLGRLASRIANLLRGKNKPTFTPHEDTRRLRRHRQCRRACKLTGQQGRDQGLPPPHGLSRRHPDARRRSGAARASGSHAAPGGDRHAAEEPPRPAAGDQAEDLRRAGASARGAAAGGGVACRGVEVMAERKASYRRHRQAQDRGGARAPHQRRRARSRSIGAPLDEYFGRPTSRMIVNQPFELTGTMGQYDVSVNVVGGGISAQAVGDPPRHHPRADRDQSGLPAGAEEGRATSPAIRARSSARSTAATRRASGRSTRSADLRSGSRGPRCRCGRYRVDRTSRATRSEKQRRAEQQVDRRWRPTPRTQRRQHAALPERVAQRRAAPSSRIRRPVPMPTIAAMLGCRCTRPAIGTATQASTSARERHRQLQVAGRRGSATRRCPCASGRRCARAAPGSSAPPVRGAPRESRRASRAISSSLGRQRGRGDRRRPRRSCARPRRSLAHAVAGPLRRAATATMLRRPKLASVR